MITREDIEARKDELMARKEELQSRFVERLDDPVVDRAMGMSLIGAGLGTIVANFVRGKRNMWAYVLPSAFVLAGLAIMGGGAVSRRSVRISAAEQNVRAELAGLDPLARGRILRDMAKEKMAPFMRHTHD